MSTAPETTAETLVTCDGVSRVYHRGDSVFSKRGGDAVTALEDISVAIAPGEVVGVSGPSGSGKSTLLHLLAGLDTPTSGTVSLDGVETTSMSKGALRRLRLNRVGLVFQRFHLLPSLTARGNVALPLVEQGLGRRERRQRATELLDAVGLGDRERHRPGALSGGEQQRVAVARALATDPAIIVADEPTGELDTETGAQVLDLLAERSEDRAVIIASHDDRALARTDRVIRLRDGRQTD